MGKIEETDWALGGPGPLCVVLRNMFGTSMFSSFLAHAVIEIIKNTSPSYGLNLPGDFPSKNYPDPPQAEDDRSNL